MTQRHCAFVPSHNRSGRICLPKDLHCSVVEKGRDQYFRNLQHSTAENRKLHELAPFFNSRNDGISAWGAEGSHRFRQPAAHSGHATTADDPVWWGDEGWCSLDRLSHPFRSHRPGNLISALTLLTLLQWFKCNACTSPKEMTSVMLLWPWWASLTSYLTIYLSY